MAVDTPSQSVVKAAGDDVARRRSRGPGKPPGAAKRTRTTHRYARAMIAPVTVVIAVIIG
jgi:arabinogalactan oligomer/maltooligosaccharide transport system permease protein